MEKKGNTTTETGYFSPVVRILEVEISRIICGSDDELENAGFVME